MKVYKIKPLEWIKIDNEYYKARVFYGIYEIWIDNNHWFWSYCDYHGVETHDCKSLEDGMKQAETHWQKMLVSSLEVVTLKDLFKIKKGEPVIVVDEEVKE